MITGGKGLKDEMPSVENHTRTKKLSELSGAEGKPAKIVFDGKLTFDKLTGVYHSRTKHEEEQPCHLVIADYDICNNKCTVEYGNPCQYFCPAQVYEMEESEGKKTLKLNPSNCVHCKTCDIADPYQIINWVPPEGGGGPQYTDL
jgi:electron-transferring-flavoprotein dehydrogenase